MANEIINVSIGATTTEIVEVSSGIPTPQVTSVAPDPSTSDLLSTIADLQEATAAGAWIDCTLLNSWVNYGGTNQVAQYRKVGDMTHVRGKIKSGSSGTIAFILPSAFAPPEGFSAPATYYSGGVAQAATVYFVSTGTTYVYFPGGGAAADIGFYIQYSTVE